MAIQPYTYQPRCSAPGCDHPARYKVAAEWSDGVCHELKNYGLACEDHRASQLERALANRENLRLAEGETVGPVEMYKLMPGKRDSELPRTKP